MRRRGLARGDVRIHPLPERAAAAPAFASNTGSAFRSREQIMEQGRRPVGDIRLDGPGVQKYVSSRRAATGVASSCGTSIVPRAAATSSAAAGGYRRRNDRRYVAAPHDQPHVRDVAGVTRRICIPRKKFSPP